MYYLKRLSEVYDSSEYIPFDDSSKIVLMSDCHRGDGSKADSFMKNRHLYIAAMSYYFDENYTYIELGDGDELWENKRLSEIMSQYSDVFLLLSKFITKDRAYFIYGNHDMCKKKQGFKESRYYRRFEYNKKQHDPLFDNVKVVEGLVLRHITTGSRIFLLHGHQVDYMNDRMWKISRFLVRYFWRPLELLGIYDPISPAKNYKRKASVENKLIEWVKREKQMLIAGHTHRSMFPEVGEPPYFNDGSCVHLNGITGIEIDRGNITLVKWSIKTKDDGTLLLGRDILAGPAKLADYFDGINNM